MKANFEGATTVELVRMYELAAVEHGRGKLAGIPKLTNQSADQIAAIYRELRSRGDAERRAILPLLLSEVPSVRAWTGAHALEFAPEQGQPILAELAREEGLIGFGAQMTLKVWREGQLRFP